MSITLAQVGELCAMLSRTYPNATFDEQSPEIWHGWLKSYDQATVIRAVAVACKNSPDFCPTPVRIAADIDAAASPLPSPDLIWAKIMKLANTIPPDHRTRAIREIAAIDPLAAHVIDEGIGWFAIANTPVEKSDHLFRKFREGLLDVRSRVLSGESNSITPSTETNVPALNGAFDVEFQTSHTDDGDNI